MKNDRRNRKLKILIEVTVPILNMIRFVQISLCQNYQHNATQVSNSVKIKNIILIEMLEFMSSDVESLINIYC